jgi:hypothetical protein
MSNLQYESDNESDNEISFEIMFKRTIIHCGCGCDNITIENIVQIIKKLKIPEYLDEFDYTPKSYEETYYSAIRCLSHPDLIRKNIDVEEEDD